MCAAMHHRGPDDNGAWSDGARVALGNRRLAIIDLSPLGHQPMSDPTEQIWLTYNGEIYNFRQLREELKQRGYEFRSRSDTEAIIHLYREYGTEMVSRLRGMFALALWDAPNRRLLLARDRLGIKPLYYAQQPSGLVFASEIKALRASELVEMRPDPLALAAFLRLGSVPGPLTSMTGVHELPPATLLRAEHGRVSLERYWEIPSPDAAPRDRGAVVDELRERLRDAVNSHLVSDVPLGVFLSGGMDSSSVVGLMRALGHARIRTFAITFREGFSEGAFASTVARHFETDHTEAVVGPEDVRSQLDRIVAAMDQPTIDGVNTYFVSMMTRRTGTIVALSGLGGDELFAGYPTFRTLPRLLSVRKGADMIPGLRPALAWALGMLPGSRFGRLREALAGADEVRRAYLGVRGLFSAYDLQGLLAGDAVAEAARRLDAAGLLAEPDGARLDPVAAVAFLEMRTYMHNQLLRDTDVMSMAHSLEVRVPLLDHRLVEFVSALPGTARMDHVSPKALLAKAVGDLLPPEIVNRPKRGFTFPLHHWLRGPLRPLAVEMVEDAARSGLFRPAAVRLLWNRFLLRQEHWSRIWAVFVAQRWTQYMSEAQSGLEAAWSR